jgi:hypothetical protein
MMPAPTALSDSSARTSLSRLRRPHTYKRMGQLNGGALALSVASVVLLLVPAVGSVYPVPSWPVNIFPYIFLAYVAVGMVWFMVLRRRPDFVDELRRRVHTEHGTGELQVTPAVVEKPRKPALA